ncbi:MAG: hypothetical protein E6Q67_10080 [Roseateles sp.]|nr:MAG: hypothetical protein E6Q67_10080 [Roseateles sp.]
MNRISTTSHRTAALHAISAATLVGLLAMTGAIWLTVAAPAEPAADIVRLERVVITGQRSPAAGETVAQLPRVVIEGRRDAAADGAQLASACTAPRDC